MRFRQWRIQAKEHKRRLPSRNLSLANRGAVRGEKSATVAKPGPQDHRLHGKGKLWNQCDVSRACASDVATTESGAYPQPAILTTAPKGRREEDADIRADVAQGIDRRRHREPGQPDQVAAGKHKYRNKPAKTYEMCKMHKRYFCISTELMDRFDRIAPGLKSLFRSANSSTAPMPTKINMKGH